MSISEIASSLATKTYKREVSALSLAGWTFLTWHMFKELNPEHIPTYKDLYLSVTGTVWLFAGAAFGADAILKYLKR